MAEQAPTRACRVYVEDKTTSMELDGFRVAFRVKKSLGKEPNTADIQISNLARETRAKMIAKGSVITLQAGYGKTLATLFKGDARTIDHIREGPTTTTRIQCGDGEVAYQHGFVNDSFKSGAKLSDVLTKVMGKLSNDTLSAKQKASVLVQAFTQGRVLYGKASEELTTLLKPTGISWSIQDGRLQFLEEGETVAGDAVLLGPDSGLIGSPEHCAPDKTGKAAPLKIKALLQVGVRPGSRIVLDSESNKGEFRVEKIDHRGDTAGQDWFSDMEAVPARFE